MEEALERMPRDIDNAFWRDTATNSDPRKANRYGTALHAAAEARRISAILELVEAGVDIDIRGYQRRSPLHCATMKSNTERLC